MSHETLQNWSGKGLPDYAMVAGIPHDIAFAMCHVAREHYVHFGDVTCFVDHVICFFKTTENFNLWYLKVIKRKPNDCVVHWFILHSLWAQLHHAWTFGILWHCWVPNQKSMAPQSTQSFRSITLTTPL